MPNSLLILSREPFQEDNSDRSKIVEVTDIHHTKCFIKYSGEYMESLTLEYWDFISLSSVFGHHLFLEHLFFEVSPRSH